MDAAFKKAKDSIGQIFDKNMQDLVRGIRNHKDNEVKYLIENDLNNLLKSSILVTIKTLEAYDETKLNVFQGQNLDLIDIEAESVFDNSKIDRDILRLSQDDIFVEETLYSNLLKSNCLVTGQPDFASVQISYKGRKIAQDSLLQYLISFRNHNEFHEQCVERIFVDILNKCSPQELSVYARYTRRGGIDINPFRSTNITQLPENARLIRQ